MKKKYTLHLQKQRDGIKTQTDDFDILTVVFMLPAYLEKY